MSNQCYHVRIKVAGDESYDFCDLSDKPCLLVSGSRCEVYEDQLKEEVDADSSS